MMEVYNGYIDGELINIQLSHQEMKLLKNNGAT
jgi:hypothetical protein